MTTDKILTKVIPEDPIFIYRKGQSFGDKIVKKILDPPTKPSMFWDNPGFFACGRCISCRQVHTRLRGVMEFQSTANSKVFKIKDFISCMTTHVVYALQCLCNLMYIGCTKRTLGKRVSEHINNIKIGYKDHSVSMHFKIKHKGDPSGLKFWGVEKLHPDWRGCNKVRELSKCETKWIYLTDTLSPRGMNVELDLNCFISDF